MFTRGQLTAYPALEDAGQTAEVRLFETEAQARAAMVRGIRRLLLLRVPTGLRSIADPQLAELIRKGRPTRGMPATVVADSAMAPLTPARRVLETVLHFPGHLREHRPA